MYFHSTSQCLKITKNLIKYIFYEDKRSLKVAKHGQFDEFLKTLGLRSNNITRLVNFDLAKVGGKCQNHII